MKNSSKQANENSLQSTGDCLRSNKYYQISEIVLVFLPAILMIVGLWVLEVESLLFNIGGVYIANIAMMGIVWLGVRLRGDSLDTIGVTAFNFTPSNIMWLVLKSIAVLVVAVLAFIVGAIIMANIVTSAPEADMTQYNYMKDNLPLLIISLFGVYLISSFGEELVYRGFLITRLQALLGVNGKWGIFLIIIISSIVFGFAHFSWGVTGIVQTTFMGAALGAAYFWTKRILWPLVLAHAVMDTLLLVQLYVAP